MRVIAGSAKSRRLKAPAGLSTRPTADRVRQTIFDILGDVAGATALDLFAGSGALGIEALSRGASHATFVDAAPAAVAVIKENLAATGFEDRSRVVRADADRFVLKKATSPFDLVFLDPPYERGLAFVAQFLDRLAAGQWIAQGGVIVIEAASGIVEPPPGMREARTRQFGRTQVTILVRES